MTFFNKFYRDLTDCKMLKITALCKLLISLSDLSKYMKCNLELAKQM